MEGSFNSNKVDQTAQHFFVGNMRVVSRRLCDVALQTATSSTRPIVQRNNGSIHSLLNECQASGEWQRALNILDDGMASGVLNERSAIVSHGMVANCLEKAGRWRETIDLLEQMRHNGLEPSAFEYNAVLRAITNAGAKQNSFGSSEESLTAEASVGMMQQIWAKMPFKERSVFSYGMMITARGKSGQWQMAVDLFDEVVSLQGRNG